MSNKAYGSVSVINVNDGTGIKQTIVTYCVGSSATTPPGNPITDEQGNILVDIEGKVLTDGEWTESVPEVQE